MRTKLLFLLAALIGAAASRPVSAEAIAIKGKDFYRDDKPWVAKGVDVNAFVKPPKFFAIDKSAQQQRAYWGETELKMVRQRLGADTLRFHISQAGLDPQSAIYDAAYAGQIVEPVLLARKHGFAVILVMDAQQDGTADLKCMPSASTVRAWQTLLPQLPADQAIMLELFNEPCKKGDTSVQAEWAAGMQSLIDAVRARGAHNILLLDGLDWARITNGLFPLVHDTIPDRMALAIHPYLVGGAFDRQQQWESKFGASARTFPAVASEWNATPTNGCTGPNTPAVALSLMRYLQSLHLGLVEWGIESTHGKIVRDHDGFAPTDYASFKACNDGSDSGGGELLVNYPHN
ncbi:MAG TPA: cellulase family glycosylhydrolase [Bradyrhizobium sp.]|nr:cellulase family glycosylhydrolase [Bradyrhizobium sp.]